jgi:hypothetical protein
VGKKKRTNQYVRKVVGPVTRNHLLGLNLLFSIKRDAQCLLKDLKVEKKASVSNSGLDEMHACKVLQVGTKNPRGESSINSASIVAGDDSDIIMSYSSCSESRKLWETWMATRLKGQVFTGDPDVSKYLKHCENKKRWLL